MNKTFLTIVLLLVLLFPAMALMLKSEGIYPSHDGVIHIDRTREYAISLKSGIIPPRLAPTMAEGIGFPMFVSNYQLPYLFAAPLELVSGNTVWAFKSVLAVSYILSGIFAFLLFKAHTKNNLAAIVGAVIFSYMPYRFANLYTRAAFGESVALMFVPLVLLSLHFIKQGKTFGTFLLSVAVFGLITSHSVIFLLFFPFFVFYYLLNFPQNSEFLKRSAAGALLGLGMSAFVIVPIALERQFLRLDESFFNIGVFGFHFLNLYSLLRIPHQGVNVGTPFQIGIATSLVFLISLVAFLFRRRAFLGFLIFTFVACIFLTQEASLFLWQNAPFLKFLVYPWRVLSLVALCGGFLASVVVAKYNFRPFAVVLIFLAIFSARHYFLNPTQLYSTASLEVPSGPVEYDTIWTNEKTFLPRSLVFSDSANVTNTEDSLFAVNFDAESASESDVVVRKLYFPGWRVYVDDLEGKVENSDGLISFKIPEGKSRVMLTFGESKARMIGDALSVFSFGILAVYLISGQIRLKSQRGES